MEAARQGEILYPVFDDLARIDGFQSGGFRGDTDTLEFYWNGDVPESGIQIIEKARAAGIEVVVHHTPYSFDEIWGFLLQLVTLLENEGIAVWGFGPNRENDTIELMGPELSDSAEQQRIALDLAQHILPADVQLAFLSNEGGYAYDSRHSDSGAPTPGNEINAGGACSSALGLRDPGVENYLLTAAHCVNYVNGTTVSIPGSTLDDGAYSTYLVTLLGANGGVANPSTSARLLDAALIGFPESAVDPYMFYGPNTTSTKVDVDGVGTAIPWNTNLCSNAAATGLNCNFERTSAQVRRCIRANTSGSCITYADIVGVSSINGTIMFGEGDSGGPVYRISNGERRVVAIVEGALSLSSTVLCGQENYYYQYAPDIRCSIVNGRVTAISQIMAELDVAMPNLIVRVT